MKEEKEHRHSTASLLMSRKRVRQQIPYYYQVSFITFIVVKKNVVLFYVRRISFCRIELCNSPFFFFLFSLPFISHIFFFFLALFLCHFYVILRYIVASMPTCYFGLLLSFFSLLISCNHYKCI